MTFGLTNSFLLGLEGFEIVFILTYVSLKIICTSKNIVLFINTCVLGE
jgi:hypothetical protein